MIKVTKLIIFLQFLFCNLYSQIPLDTVITSNGNIDHFRVLYQDEELLYYSRDGTNSQVPIGVIKEIKYGFDFSLDVDESSKKIRYEKIIPAIGKDKLQLYLLAREWLVDAFVDSKEVIQFDDKESGKIIGKGNANITVPFSSLLVESERLYFTIRISTKNDKIKFVIEDFYIKQSSKKYGSADVNPSQWLWKGNSKKRNNYVRKINRIEKVCKNAIFSLLENIDKHDSDDDNW